MCLKPRHLKHLVFEVLVEDLVVEVDGISLEFLLCGVGSFEKFEIDFSFFIWFFLSKIFCRIHHCEHF